MPSVDIRGVQRATGSGDAQQQAGMDGNKNLLTAQGMPVYAEMSRLGESYTVGTATLFAPLVARPTTTAALEVFNNSSTRVMVVADLYAEQILSTAAQQTYGIYAMITTTKAVPTLTALSLFSNSGKAVVTPTAAGEVVTGVGTTVVANGWRPWGPALECAGGRQADRAAADLHLPPHRGRAGDCKHLPCGPDLQLGHHAGGSVISGPQ
jgi:hypothetical protein